MWMSRVIVFFFATPEQHIFGHNIGWKISPRGPGVSKTKKHYLKHHLDILVN